MRILMIRHGDPDYVHDSLTEKGKVEAALLAERMTGEQVKDFYVSPLGRARETASYTLNKMNRTAQVCDWLQEFPAKVDINGVPALEAAYPDTKKNDGMFQKRILWDMLPSYWKNRPEYFEWETWRESEAAVHSDICQVYDWMSRGLDALLERYGYVRQGAMYHTEKGTSDTIVFFCHFGATCAMLSHLWNVSPFVLWHSLAMAPTSVTEVFTEERERGQISFRATRIGDTGHLYAGNEQPSFSARFCEKYDSEDRH